MHAVLDRPLGDPELMCDAGIRAPLGHQRQHFALLRFAAGRNLNLGGSCITARVGIGPLERGGFGLAAALDLDALRSPATWPSS